MTIASNSRYTSKVTPEQRRINAVTPMWTIIEVSYLMEKSETVFLTSLYKSYNEWAIKHGYAPRTKHAILTQLTRYEKSRFPSCNPEEYSDTSLAKALQIDKNVLRRFRLSNLPKIKMCGRYAIWGKVEINTLCDWRPQIFCGRSYETLLLLLNDDYQAKFFASMPWASIRDVPVRHKETGKVYCSSQEASIALNIPYHVINEQCLAKTQKSLKYPGRTFEYVFPPNKILRGRPGGSPRKQVNC